MAKRTAGQTSTRDHREPSHHNDTIAALSSLRALKTTPPRIQTLGAPNSWQTIYHYTQLPPIVPSAEQD